MASQENDNGFFAPAASAPLPRPEAFVFSMNAAAKLSGM